MKKDILKSIALGVYHILSSFNANKQDLKNFCQELLEWGEYFQVPKEVPNGD